MRLFSCLLAPVSIFSTSRSSLLVQEARRCLDRLLKISPNCRQAISLRDVVDDKIAKGTCPFGLALSSPLFLLFPALCATC